MIQDQEEIPQPDWKFVAQFAVGTLVLTDGPISTEKDNRVYDINGQWMFEWPDLGSATSYVFTRSQDGKSQAEKVEGWFFYQC